MECPGLEDIGELLEILTGFIECLIEGVILAMSEG